MNVAVYLLAKQQILKYRKQSPESVQECQNPKYNKCSHRFQQLGNLNANRRTRAAHVLTGEKIAS